MAEGAYEEPEAVAEVGLLGGGGFSPTVVAGAMGCMEPPQPAV